jgi:hypothetical protein
VGIGFSGWFVDAMMVGCALLFPTGVLMFIARCCYCVALRAKRLYIINSDALKPRIIDDVLA